jgi:hypothetical protein
MGSEIVFGFIGVLGGLIGIVACFIAARWGAGYGEYLGGKKRMFAATPLEKDKLRQQLLDLNSPHLPYEIKLSDETDLILEWKIADAKWFSLFAQERLKTTYRAFFVLDQRRSSVRYCEEIIRVQWMAGTSGLQPKLTYKSQFFRGRVLFQKSWGVQYAIKEDLTLGKVYEYKFDIGQIRDPLRKVIEESGWEFVAVVRREHATYQSLTP